ncbi:hypothetical protein [Bradyrhizobium sp. BRP56]|uniref:hypothetical protein n=1 Tax=Bradyrhizobium sp. BRP56 TaxID=2793819 RepID=UPI001CD79ADF|nr:hypothetical protein [Bradyrhizobium sp. BRP56]MCA1398338.1 hypothetical protein [Bradyrhizobium sp. BRP56]
MRGLDPRIHRKRERFSVMDCRVKPGNDDGGTGKYHDFPSKFDPPHATNRPVAWGFVLASAPGNILVIS